ncbi:unnamed protein product [Blepharisma stoltei]|uniref:Uncharacterized protein n=1 Tax=Blepharisma stoltei TaxID=1481888 RepID=A0AAU9JE50_9CILI|nr:unnamed protein product [Blepharisma stoltei]
MYWIISINMDKPLLIRRNPRTKALMKFTFDLISCAIIMVTFLVTTFSYGNTYYISMQDVTKKFEYNGMDAYTLTTFEEFDKYYCTKPEGTDSEVCDWTGHFKAAALCYLIDSIVCLVIMVYNVLNLLSLSFGCTCFKILSLQISHYLVPIAYSIGIILYLSVSNFYSLSEDGETWSDWSVTFGAGIVLMFVNEGIMIAGALYFWWARVHGLEDILLHIGNLAPLIDKNQLRSI